MSGITFGSVGDIVSLCLLIKDLVKALNDCSGARRDFKQIISELESLERALLEIDLLIRRHQHTPTLSGLFVSATNTASSCRASIDKVLKVR